MSSTTESAYEAQKALIDFYNNLPNEYKWDEVKSDIKSHNVAERTGKLEQYLKQYAVPNISNLIGGLHINLYQKTIGDRDVFFYSGDYMGYHLADGEGGYAMIRYILTPRRVGQINPNIGVWNIYPKLLNSWGHNYDTWDITDLVLKKKSNPLFSFLNWINENPLEVKQ